MINFALPTYEVRWDARPSLDQAKRVAELAMEDARLIAAGGLATATEWARAWYRAHPTKTWTHAVERDPRLAAALLKTAAEDAFVCANKIVKRGRAWFIQDDMLVVATLIADASAGQDGYMPLINTHA